MDSVEYSLLRFARYGLIELLRPGLLGLLDSPLDQREELAAQLNTIAANVRPCLAVHFVKSTDTNRILAVTTLRRLSTDFDRAIIASLSDAEKTKVAAVVREVFAMSLDMIREDAEKFLLGSALLGQPK